MNITNGVLKLGKPIQNRGGIAAILSEANPLLKAREIMVETDTGKMKIGDGIHSWNDLEYAGNLSSETWSMVLNGEKTSVNKEVVIWENSYSISIVQSETQAITDFCYCRYASKTFTAVHNLPANIVGSNTFNWSITGLPEGLLYMANSDTLTIYGNAEAIGTSQVTITITLGEYTDTKVFTFDVTDDGFVPELVLTSDIPVFYDDKQYSFTVDIAKDGVAYTAKGFSVIEPSWLTADSQGVIKGKAVADVPNANSVKVKASYMYNNKQYTIYKDYVISAYNIVPVRRYPRVIIDLTAMMRITVFPFEQEFSLDISDVVYKIDNINGSFPVGVNFGTDPKYPDDVNQTSSTVNLSYSKQNKIQLGVSSKSQFGKLNLKFSYSKYNNWTSASAYSKTYWLCIKNNFGSAMTIPFEIKIASKEDYETNEGGKYSNMYTPIVTYSLF